MNELLIFFFIKSISLSPASCPLFHLLLFLFFFWVFWFGKLLLSTFLLATWCLWNISSRIGYCLCGDFVWSLPWICEFVVRDRCRLYRVYTTNLHWILEKRFFLHRWYSHWFWIRLILILVIIKVFFTVFIIWWLQLLDILRFQWISDNFIIHFFNRWKAERQLEFRFDMLDC